MPLEMAPPKYARVVAELQERISKGTYAAGQMLPSEEQLVNEFGVSRTTVIRALQILGQQGWIDAQQGKGRFVRGRPRTDDRARPGQDLLDQSEDNGFGLLESGHVVAPDAVAAALNLKKSEAVLMRRSLVTRDGEPSELVTSYFPMPLVYGTDLGSGEPLSESVRRHIETRHKLRYDHVTERISSRAATADEAAALEMPTKRGPVLVVTITAYDVAARPLQHSYLVFPGDRHEIEDTYTLV